MHSVQSKKHLCQSMMPGLSFNGLNGCTININTSSASSESIHSESVRFSSISTDESEIDYLFSLIQDEDIF